MLNFLFNPCGRVSRSQIWLGLFLPQFVVGFVAGFLDGAAGVASLQSGEMVGLPAFGLAAAAFFFWPNIAVTAKRFHDRDMTGWWVLGFLLLVIGGVIGAALGLGLIGILVSAGAAVAQFVILYLMPGTQGPNRFGDDPRNGTIARAALDAGSYNPQPGWAERLSDTQALADAAAGAAGEGAKDRAARAASAFRRAARSAHAPLQPGGRPAFGRRGA